jgi:exonuclease SbcC
MRPGSALSRSEPTRARMTPVTAQTSPPNTLEPPVGPRSPAWQPLQQTLAEACGGLAAFHERVQVIFGDLDRLRDDLDRRAHDIARQENDLARREAAFADQRKEIGRLSHQVEHREAETASAWAEVEKLKAELHVADKERKEWRARWEATAADPTGNAESAKELVEAKKELAAAKKKIEDLQQQLKSYEGLENAQETIAELEQDRADLEAELQLVRDRAEELYNKVREQKEELHDQRDALVSELKQLRRIVERQAELLAESRRNGDGATHVIKSIERDPVLDSVTSQFARLHKDVTSRRNSKPRRERPE